MIKLSIAILLLLVGAAFVFGFVPTGLLTIDTSNAVIDVGVGSLPYAEKDLGNGIAEETYVFTVGHAVFTPAGRGYVTIVDDSTLSRNEIKATVITLVGESVKDMGWSNNELNITWR